MKKREMSSIFPKKKYNEKTELIQKDSQNLNVRKHSDIKRVTIDIDSHIS